MKRKEKKERNGKKAREREKEIWLRLPLKRMFK
jgi:hypothetical protein